MQLDLDLPAVLDALLEEGGVAGAPCACASPPAR